MPRRELTLDPKLPYTSEMYAYTDGEKRLSWEADFSDPNGHNSEKYLYLVHAIMPPELKAITRSGVPLDEYDPNQNIDLLDDPSQIHKKNIVCASAIDQIRHNTFGHAGLIIKAPWRNVVSMTNATNGSNFYTKNANVGDRFRIVDLVKRTYRTAINEIDLKGSTDEGNVETIGVFVKVDNEGDPLDEWTSERIIGLSMELGLPLIKISENPAKHSF